MGKPKKEYVNLSIKMNKTISDALSIMSQDTGITKTWIIEHATMEYIERYNQTGIIKPTEISPNQQ